MHPDDLSLTHAALEAAGFIWQTELPRGTRYEHGRLYIRLATTGTLRVFIPDESDQVEVSSGSVFQPHVHYTGPVRDAAELQRFLEGYEL